MARSLRPTPERAGAPRRHLAARPRWARSQGVAAVAAVSCLAGSLAAGAGTGAAAASPKPRHAGHATRGSGPVDVLYAGSLLDLMNKLGPAFDKATGYTFEGFPAGSTALANEIKGKTQVADVFISAGTATNSSLVGPRNGSWESWYAQFGTTPLLLGYSTTSKFAHDLRTEPWYRVVTKAGFRLGRTDPAIDPKGVLAVTALDRAAKAYRDPALRRLVSSTAGVFPEEALVGRLQAGQLDAGFFYGVEAKAAKLATVGLGTIKLVSPYTITVVNRAPHEAGAVAFVSYLLSAKGAAMLRQNGITLDSPPILSGTRSDVPAPLKRLFR